MNLNMSGMRWIAFWCIRMYKCCDMLLYVELPSDFAACSSIIEQVAATYVVVTYLVACITGTVFMWYPFMWRCMKFEAIICQLCLKNACACNKIEMINCQYRPLIGTYWCSPNVLPSKRRTWWAKWPLAMFRHCQETQVWCVSHTTTIVSAK